MENASKALLIAGAILIIIILISIGIRIFNSNAETQNQVNSISPTISAAKFNANLSFYFSNSTSADQAKALISHVQTHNKSVNPSGSFSADSHQIYINLYPKNNPTLRMSHYYTTSQLNTLYNKISNTYKYKIYVTPSCSTPSASKGYYNGYILCVTIEEI